MPEPLFTLPTISAEDALSGAQSGVLDLLDMRKPEAASASGMRVKGAAVRDPFRFGHDDPLMRSTKRIAVFCVHGHEVSHFGCALLRVHGVEAVLVEGGFEALRTAGGVMNPLEEAK